MLGHDQDGGPLRPFPGTVNPAQRILLPEDAYIALQFTVPDNFNTAAQGMCTLAEGAVNGHPYKVSITIRTRCGNFRPTAAAPTADRCILDASDLDGCVPWNKAGLTSRCQLQAGRTYYLDRLYAPLDAPTTSGCHIRSRGAPILNRKSGPATGHSWQRTSTSP